MATTDHSHSASSLSAFRLSNGSLSTPTTYAVPTPRRYHEELGARLKLVAVFDDEERRVPIHLGKEDPTA